MAPTRQNKTGTTAWQNAVGGSFGDMTPLRACNKIIFGTLGCLICARGIQKAWMGANTPITEPGGPPTPGSYLWQHACNPGYSHCMSCCTLARVVGGGDDGAECAALAQVYQDDRYYSTPEKTAMRYGECIAGIVVAGNLGATCHASCSLTFPIWNAPGSNNICKSLKPPPKGQPAPPSWSLPPLRTCNNVR